MRMNEGGLVLHGFISAKVPVGIPLVFLSDPRIVPGAVQRLRGSYYCGGVLLVHSGMFVITHGEELDKMGRTGAL